MASLNRNAFQKFYGNANVGLQLQLTLLLNSQILYSDECKF